MDRELLQLKAAGNILVRPYLWQLELSGVE